MAKSDALDELAGRVSKADLEAYTDVVYVDVADPAINGLDEHSQSGAPHSIPDIVSAVNSQFAEVGAAIETKIGVDYQELALKANVTGETFTGTVKSDTIANAIEIDGPTGSNREIVGQTNSLRRWRVNMGDSAPESGANEGAEFSVSRYADNGTFLGTPFGIDRKTGKTYVNRINIGGTIMQSGGLDIRYEETRPTNDLELGTMWIIGQEVGPCGNITTATLNPNLLRWSSSDGDATTGSDSVIGSGGSNTLVDALDTTFVSVFSDLGAAGVPLYAVYAVLPELNIPYGASNFTFKLTARVRRMQTIPTITGYTPSTTAINSRVKPAFEIRGVVAPGGYAIPAQRSAIESNPTYDILDDWPHIHADKQQLATNDWVDYVWEFNQGSLFSHVQMLINFLRTGTLSLWMSSGDYNDGTPADSQISGVDISALKLELSYLDVPCAQQVPFGVKPKPSHDGYVPNSIDNQIPLNSTQFFSSRIVDASITATVSSFETNEILAYGKVGTSGFAPTLLASARVNDSCFVTTAVYDDKLYAVTATVSNGVITFGTPTLIYTLSEDVNIYHAIKVCTLAGNKVGVLFTKWNVYSQSGPYTTGVIYIELSINPSTNSITSITTPLVVEADRDVSLGGWTIADAVTDSGSDGVLAVINTWTLGGPASAMEYITKIVHIISGATPTKDVSFVMDESNFPVFTRRNNLTQTVKRPQRIAAGPNDSLYFTTWEMAYTLADFDDLSEIAMIIKWNRSGNSYVYSNEWYVRQEGRTVPYVGEWNSGYWNEIGNGENHLYLVNTITHNTDNKQTREGPFLLDFDTSTDTFTYNKIDIQPYETPTDTYEAVFNPWNHGAGVFQLSAGRNDEQYYDGPYILKNQLLPAPSEYGFNKGLIDITNVANVVMYQGEEYYNVSGLSAVKVSSNRAIVSWVQLATNYGDINTLVPTTMEFALVGSVNGEIIVLDTHTHNLPFRYLTENFEYSNSFSMNIGGNTRAIFAYYGYIWKRTGYYDDWLADTTAHTHGNSSSGCGMIANVGVVNDLIDITYVSSYGRILDPPITDPILPYISEYWYGAMPLETEHILALADPAGADRSAFIKINAATGAVVEAVKSAYVAYGPGLVNANNYVIYGENKSWRGNLYPLTAPTEYLTDDLSTAMGKALGTIDFRTPWPTYLSQGRCIMGYYGQWINTATIHSEEFVHQLDATLNTDFTISGESYGSCLSADYNAWQPGIPRNQYFYDLNWDSNAAILLPNGHVGYFYFGRGLTSSFEVLLFENGLSPDSVGDTTPFKTGTIINGSDIYPLPLRYENEFALENFGYQHNDLAATIAAVCFDDGTGFATFNITDNWYGKYYKAWLAPFKVPILPV